jgi:serine/threonine protein phosphatase PrpC
MAFDCAIRTHVGLRRKLNEDSLASIPERGLWVVADGMGGHAAGEVASAMVVEALEVLPAATGLDNLVGKVVGALEEVNRALVELGNLGSEPRTIGSTVVGLAIENAEYRCFWAGDSRAYRLRGGSLTQLTRDHSLVQDLVDAGMLAAEDAEGHPNANVITRAVGAAPAVDIDVIGGGVEPGDVFLIASDGLTRKVDGVEIATVLGSAPIEQAADRLIDLVLERGAPDNVTLVIVRAT